MYRCRSLFLLLLCVKVHMKSVSVKEIQDWNSLCHCKDNNKLLLTVPLQVQETVSPARPHAGKLSESSEI